ncbi:fructose-bisphosphate aldolase [Cellulosimicrobium aquatile]|uniref:Fructose-bisphosphate aldolase n=1 Tax=Cellulosimicrobium aquatile TaxID=1612203 RepID=A0A1N6Q433_9MICO|nr:MULTISPECIES: ketose-bisphosphate aldolase [Cellulosimicrobium]MDQ8042688.1 ketose-bisphosphate aldolase [Cellulosimicrobium sp. XJ-DQ-B-000]SIQ11305.1 fructose-bisphosphate aldolase [Cellulosimicrobium aquatile]
MTLVTNRTLLDAAARGGYGVGAFNVADLAMATAVLDAARATESPVIVETLAGSHPYASDALWWSVLRTAIAAYPDVPVALHLDHGPDEATCARAVAAGFTSVMIDGSLGPDGRPAAFEDNVAVTRRVVEHAHAHGVSVEGELGTIGGSKDGRSHAEIVLADPEQAEEFVRRTGVDALAVAIGTSHGAYKFTSPPDGSVLHMDLVERIARRVPGTHLVMHGSSGLPADLRATINAHGGDLPESWGVPDAEKARAASLGVRKINQGMDHYMAFTAGVRVALAASPGDVDPAGYLALGREWAQRLVEERMVLFGQAGRASDVLPAAAGTPAAG